MLSAIGNFLTMRAWSVAVPGPVEEAVSGSSRQPVPEPGDDRALRDLKAGRFDGAAVLVNELSRGARGHS